MCLCKIVCGGCRCGLSGGDDAGRGHRTEASRAATFQLERRSGKQRLRKQRLCLVCGACGCGWAGG